MTRQAISFDEPSPAGTAGISRRTFVKRLGLGAAAVASCALLEGAPATASASGGPTDAAANEDAIGVLIDLTRCSGCQSCALACKVSNAMPLPTEAPTGLSSGALSFVDTRPESAGSDVYVKRQCMHCLHPACVSACTVGALRKTALGPVVYDADKCIGCRYCQYACPFGVPTYQWENPLGLIHKCELCFDRVTAGELPACVAACPNGALRFGKRTELLAQAKAQIASRPGRYVDHIFGEHEVGGTSMLYLSDVPFARLGFPALGERTVSGYAETVMQLTPAVAAAVATLATGLHMIFRRRQQALEFKLQEAEAPRAANRTQQKEELL
jgi:formate dehydrogenase iron-sulfur subunit